MRTFLIFLIVLFTEMINAQFYRYSNCKCDLSSDLNNPYFDKFLIEDYFKSKLSQERIDSLNGSVFLLIYVDKKGNSCCRAIRNTTDSDINDLKLFKLISHLPKWKPALYKDEVFEGITPKKDEPITSKVVLQLKFSNFRLQVDTLF